MKLLILTLAVLVLVQSIECWRWRSVGRTLNKAFTGQGKRDAEFDVITADGVITMEEMANFMDVDDVQMIFAEFDEDDDGVLNQEEFEAFYLTLEAMSSQ
ncbi:hypothetical protein SNE40_005210 [Patella caerulea]|uniref:EF-hand domain-containing protein n=1 Tax=Patella caerulea TaxID=87958 RepID=A0AAN8K2G7_PATCE